MSLPPLPGAALRAKAQHVRTMLEEGEAACLPSPCVSVCRMDDAGVYCKGCLRTLDELRDWGTGDAMVQQRIWMAVLQRCARHG